MGDTTSGASFVDALEAARAGGRLPVISEVKCISPKDGDLLAGRDPAELARTMVEAGAACISVVTEPRHFGGSMELLREVTAAANVPVLRKDFVTDAKGVEATREAGASCLLLTVAKMDWQTLVDLRGVARSIGLQTLVEVHDREEMDRALLVDPDLLGINNRDILRLERDDGTVSNTLELIRAVPQGVRVLSESAIASPADARAAVEAGALAVLVGTYVLRAPDTAEAVRGLVSALN